MMLALEIGQRYRIVHRSEMQRKNRVSVMTYLGASTHRDSGEWNARPAAGTQSLPWGWIKSLQPVDSSVPHSVNKVV